MVNIWPRCDQAPYSDRPPGEGVVPEGREAFELLTEPDARAVIR